MGRCVELCRLFLQHHNESRLDRLFAMFADDASVYGQVWRGRAAFEPAVRAFWAAYPQLRYEADGYTELGGEARTASLDRAYLAPSPNAAPLAATSSGCSELPAQPEEARLKSARPLAVVTFQFTRHWVAPDSGAQSVAGLETVVFDETSGKIVHVDAELSSGSGS